MCTVTWIHAAEGYALLFNRDERSSRGPEEAPRVARSRGVLFVAPRDGDAGGTWIATNEYGLTLCLLNGYGLSRREAPTQATSRGRLVLDLVDAARVEEVEERWQTLDLSRFPAFTLVSLSPGTPARLFEWDGLDRRTVLDAGSRMPVASSSVDQAGAAAYRSSLLASLARAEGGLTAEVLERFHCSHGDAPGPLTPCMHRSDASTRSLCRARVTQEHVEFDYAPGAPCRTPLGSPIEIARRPLSGTVGRG